MKRNGNKGITLIALVVTIIVLLILAGVSIAMLTGENGLINQTINANKQTDIAGTREQIELELMGKYDTEVNYTNDDVIQAVKTVTGQEVEEGTATITTAKGNEVNISDLWKRIIKVISPTDSYVGYYADIDGDYDPNTGIGVDGVIYADLAVGNTSDDGIWNNCDTSNSTYNSYGTYKIPIVESGLKTYTISEEKYTGDFGENYVLTANGAGTDRFYVMALEDLLHATTSYWYAGCSRIPEMEDYNQPLSLAFGSGKSNTIYMLNEWRVGSFGSGTTTDVWGVIRSQTDYLLVESDTDSCRWFLPSASEFAAFGEELNIETETTKQAQGLDFTYFTSSAQYSRLWMASVWSAYGSKDGYIVSLDVGGSYNFALRLSCTF